MVKLRERVLSEVIPLSCADSPQSGAMLRKTIISYYFLRMVDFNFGFENLRCIPCWPRHPFLSLEGEFLDHLCEDEIFQPVLSLVLEKTGRVPRRS